MKFQKRFQLHRIATVDSRYAISGIMLEKGRALATDGRCAAIVPIEVEPDDVVDRIVPTAAWDAASKAARAPKRGEDPVARIDAEPRELAPFRVLSKDGQTMTNYNVVDGRFPEVDAVFPRGAEHVRIGINASLLLALAQAIGAEGSGLDGVQGVELIVYANTLGHPKDGGPVRVEGPIEVRPLERGVGSRGCIMPIAEY